MANVKYCYDGKFEGNILIVGQTGCGKTTLNQSIAKNDLFRGIKRNFLDIKNISFNRKRRKYKEELL